MYQVFCDDNLIYDPTIAELKIASAKVTLELNKTGSFTFTIYPSNPYIGILKKLKSVITVYQDGFMLFRGRILNDKEGFYGEKQITCEGELAFLLDSIQRPFDFTGTPAELFTQLIQNHNGQVEETKQFKVGNITVVDPNDYIARSDTEYTDTLTLINEQLINILGGYVFIRHEADGNYIDYLADFDTLNTQTIEFGKNLLDLSKITKGENIATAVIPLGAKLPNESEGEGEGEGTEEDAKRLTIADVNGGLDYVYSQEAVDRYGWIYVTSVFDDVTDPNNLLRKGQEYLSEIINLVVSLELNAVDLAGLNKDISAFRMGSYVKVLSLPHDLDQNMLVKKLSIDLFKPSSNKLTLGISYSSFLDDQVALNGSLGTIVNQINNVQSNFATNITIIENNVQSMINQSSDELLFQVEESYYKKDETDTLISSMSTALKQTSEYFEMLFNEFNQEMNDLNDGSNSKFEEISRYIRFVDGNIVLGEIGNELTLKLEHGRIVFMENMKEIAYFTNQKLYVTDSEVTTSLKIGQFAFIPRENGNLSFKRVG